MSGLTSLWNHLTATDPAPPTWTVALSAAAAVVIVANERAWRVARTVVTITHEGGHAAVSVATGRRLEGIRLHADTSGATSSRGKTRGAGMVLTAAAGYLSPPVVGLAAAWLLAAGHAAALLAAALVLLAATFAVVRNAFGFVAVLAAAALVAAVTRFTSASAQDGFAYLLTWFLLLGGVRAVVELHRERRRFGGARSDADQLARLTGLPRGLWVALFGTVALAALALGGYWLTPAALHAAL